MYISVLNWLMPERIGEKRKARHAYPIGGEYVVDVDANTVWRPHSHGEVDHVCAGCLRLAYEATLYFLDKIGENHSDFRVVFSGRRGFHIHVLDFDPWDWTYYNERNPVKRHEVVRFKYSLYLSKMGYGQNRHHFVLSCDMIRIIIFPGSLNGETGLICSILEGLGDFERMSVTDIMWNSKAIRFIFDLDFTKISELRSHPELEGGIRR